MMDWIYFMLKQLKRACSFCRPTGFFWMQFASAGLPVDARAAEEDDRRQQVVHDLHSQHI